MTSDPFSRQFRDAVAALTRRVRQRDQSGVPADPELFALEFMTALRGHGWRPVEALQPPRPTSGSRGELPAEYLERKAALAARTDSDTPERKP